MKKNDSLNEMIKCLSLIPQLGFTMAACIIIGLFIGRFIDKLTGASPWFMLIFAVLGAAAAFKVLYDMAKEWFK